jgi:ABC-type transporter Mla MlaB component
VSDFLLPDHIDFDNLMTVRKAGEEHIDANPQPVFSLQGITDASSAAVALLVAWFRYAHVRGKVAAFVHVPASIMNIIEVTELDEMLQIDDAAAPGSPS